MKAYQLKIVIKNSKPPIWRRCIVPAGITFSQLAIILNEVMGWSGSHLFEFEFDHLQLTLTEDYGFNEFVSFGDYGLLESSATYINEYMEDQDWFTYTYDLGDNWQHRVTIEQIIPDYQLTFPQVLKYKGNCPMEDCGGIYGYYECLEVLSDKTHPEHEEHLQWVESQGYPNEYKMSQINHNLEENYFVRFGRGGKKQYGDLFDDIVSGKGLIGSKTAKNTAEPIRAPFYKTKGRLRKDNMFFHPEVKLKDIFNCYNIQYLLQAAELLKISSPMQYKKEDLIEMIVGKMLQPENMKKVFICLRDDEISAFEKAIKNGYGFSPSLKEMPSLDRLIDHGYIGIREDYLIDVPIDVKEAYEKINTGNFHKERKQISWLIACFNISERLYGIAPIDILVKVYNRNTALKTDTQDFCALIKKAPAALINFTQKDDLFIHNELLEAGDDYKDLMACQGNKKFYIPSRNEIEDLSENGFFTSEEHIFELMSFMINDLGMSEEKARDITATIQAQICIGYNMQEVMDTIYETDSFLFNEKDGSKLIALINNAWNHTRMLLNRGYTPYELATGGKTRMNTSGSKKNTSSTKAKIIEFSKIKKK